MCFSLPALRSKNYRLFFAGQGISLIGTWMTQLATIWLVYDLTKSPLMLGVVGFSSQIPSFFLAPFGGVFVDRFSRYRTLIFTQILAMIPVGNLLGGLLASHIGASNTLIIDGIACIIGSIVFSRQLPALRKIMRPIYEQKGIIIRTQEV